MEVGDLEQLSADRHRIRIDGPTQDGAEDESYSLMIEGPAGLGPSVFIINAAPWLGPI